MLALAGLEFSLTSTNCSGCGPRCFQETGKCSCFDIPTLANLSSVIRNGVSVTLAASYSSRVTPYTIEIWEGLHIQTMKKQILIGPRDQEAVCGNSKPASVNTFASFLRKTKLVSVLCGSHKILKGLSKIQESLEIFFKVQCLSTPPRPIQTYHFQANLIWRDVPFKQGFPNLWNKWC